jgi:hypothetical protein
MKSQIIERLGIIDILLPALIAEGLAANDRVKARLSVLQAAGRHAREPQRARFDMTDECRTAGIVDRTGNYFDGTGNSVARTGNLVRKIRNRRRVRFSVHTGARERAASPHQSLARGEFRQTLGARCG